MAAAENEAISKTEKIAELEDQIKAMAEDSETSRREIDALKAASSESADASAAAAIEHEALLKARADLEAIKSETAALTAAHEAASGVRHEPALFGPLRALLGNISIGH